MFADNSFYYSLYNNRKKKKNQILLRKSSIQSLSYSVLNIRKSASNFFITFSVNNKILFNCSAGSSGLRRKARRRDYAIHSLINEFKKFVREYIKIHNHFLVFRDIVVLCHAPIRLIKKFIKSIRRYIVDRLFLRNEKSVSAIRFLFVKYKSCIYRCSISILQIHNLIRQITMHTREFHLLSGSLRIVTSHNVVIPNEYRESLFIFYSSYIFRTIYVSNILTHAKCYDLYCYYTLFTSYKSKRASFNIFFSRWAEQSELSELLVFMFFYYMSNHRRSYVSYLCLVAKLNLFKKQKVSTMFYTINRMCKPYVLFNSFSFMCCISSCTFLFLCSSYNESRTAFYTFLCILMRNCYIIFFFSIILPHCYSFFSYSQLLRLLLFILHMYVKRLFYMLVQFKYIQNSYVRWTRIAYRKSKMLFRYIKKLNRCIAKLQYNFRRRIMLRRSRALSRFRILIFINKSTIPFNGCRSSKRIS